jgi:hypothetical protein
VDLVNSDVTDKLGVANLATISVLADILGVFDVCVYAFRSRAALQLEIIALRHQLGVLQRSVKRPKLTRADRALWAWLCTVWNDWQSGVSIVKVSTVIGWHGEGFRLFWTWKIRPGKRGRPAVPKGVRDLIRSMSREIHSGVLRAFMENC